MSVQQRPTRYYITQEEDHTVVRSVPMARRVRTLLPPEERTPEAEQQAANREMHRRSMAARIKSAVKRK